MKIERNNEIKKDQEQKENDTSFCILIGMSIGMSIGTAIGVVTANIPVFIGIGLGVGMMLGLVFSLAIKQNNEKWVTIYRLY